MKKKVVSLLICSALMMVEGVTTYAQTLSTSPADSNKTTIEAPSENKEQKKKKVQKISVKRLLRNHQKMI